MPGPAGWDTAGSAGCGLVTGASSSRMGAGHATDPDRMRNWRQDPWRCCLPLGNSTTLSPSEAGPAIRPIDETGRLLATARASAVPPRPVRLDASWLARVDPAGGPVHVR